MGLAEEEYWLVCGDGSARPASSFRESGEAEKRLKLRLKVKAGHVVEALKW